MNNVKISTLRKVGEEVGRPGVSEMALKMVGEFDAPYRELRA